MINIDQKNYFKSFEKIYKTNNLNVLRNKSMLITGANGLIGATLLDFFLFLNKEHNFNLKLSAMVRSTPEKLYFFDYTSVKFIKNDVVRPVDFEGDLNYIFHAASNASPSKYDSEPVETIFTNVLGTANMLNLAREKNARLIYLSSSEVYGNKSELLNGLIKEEDYGYIDILNSRSCYSESKRVAETLIISYQKEFGIDAVIARPGYIFGERINMSSNRADVQFIKNAIKGETIILHSSGEQRRSYMYIMDFISALLNISLYGKSCEAYNVSSDSGNISLYQFAEHITNEKNIYLKTEIKEVKGGSKIMDSELDNTKLKLLGWKENFEIKEAIKTLFLTIREQ